MVNFIALHFILLLPYVIWIISSSQEQILLHCLMHVNVFFAGLFACCFAFFYPFECVLLTHQLWLVDERNCEQESMASETSLCFHYHLFYRPSYASHIHSEPFTALQGRNNLLYTNFYNNYFLCLSRIGTAVWIDENVSPGNSAHCCINQTYWTCADFCKW